MKVLLQADGPHDPVELSNLSFVGVYDDFDQLALLVWKVSEGNLCLTRAGEKDFDRLVREMGLEKRPVVTHVSLGPK